MSAAVAIITIRLEGDVLVTLSREQGSVIVGAAILTPKKETIFREYCGRDEEILQHVRLELIEDGFLSEADCTAYRVLRESIELVN